MTGNKILCILYGIITLAMNPWYKTDENTIQVFEIRFQMHACRMRLLDRQTYYLYY